MKLVKAILETIQEMEWTGPVSPMGSVGPESSKKYEKTPQAEETQLRFVQAAQNGMDKPLETEGTPKS